MSDVYGMPMIEAQGLGKFYGNFAAIRDVSFAVPPGQVAAFFWSQRSRTINDLEDPRRLLSAKCRRGSDRGPRCLDPPY